MVERGAAAGVGAARAGLGAGGGAMGVGGAPEGDGEVSASTRGEREGEGGRGGANSPFGEEDATTGLTSSWMRAGVGDVAIERRARG